MGYRSMKMPQTWSKRV